MTLSWLTAIDFGAGICAYASIQHFLIARHTPVDRSHLVFGILCALGAVFFLLTSGVYRVDSAAALLDVRRWQMATGIVFIGALPWFVACYCRMRSFAAPAALSTYMAVILIAHFSLPYGVEMSGMPEFHYMTLPWGERVVDIRAVPRGFWHYAWWLGMFAVFAFGLHSALRYAREFERKRGLALALGLAFFLVCLVLQFAVNHRWIDFTNFGEFGLLALIVQMSFALTQQLRENERRLQLVMDNVPAAVYLKDMNGRYLFMNRECELYVGRPAAELIGKTDYDLFPAERADAMRANDRHLMQTGKPVQFEEQVESAGSELRTYISIKAPLCYANGVPYGVCGVARDITRQKAGEQEVRELRGQLWRADRVARSGVMAASLAHELNQPLAAILHNAQAGRRFLKSGTPSLQEIDEILSDIVRDDKRAAGVISGLYAFVRNETPEREPLDLAAVVEEMLGLLNFELLKHSIEVDTAFNGNCRINGNKAQLQQVFLNLITNSIDAMRDQPQHERRLDIVVDCRSDGKIDCSVRDNGEGIAPETSNKVFDAFFTSKPSGMGLGLAICRSIVHAHGGTISMVPNLTRGVTVIFSLASHPAAAPVAQSPEKFSTPGG